MFGKYYALKISILILISLAVGFGLAYSLARPRTTAYQSTPSIALLDSDKAQDGLVGSVHQIKTETAKLFNRSGKLVEGPRQLMELVTYDTGGKRIGSSHYLVQGASYNGREEYVYDDKGNLVDMTVRDVDNSVLAKESYRYEFDSVGNWTRMTTSAVVFEEGKASPMPAEVTYRSITYYFDKNIANASEEQRGADAKRAEEGLPDTFASLRESLDEWVKATNARDIEKTISFYDSKVYFYYRKRNVSRDFVRSDKAPMFERAELIDVRADAPEITLDRDNRTATMRFHKQYLVRINELNRYGEVLQEMRWQRTDDGWKIIGERDVRVMR